MIGAGGPAAEPEVKRAITFIDGQNLYHGAREAFGVSHPNYDVLALSKFVCEGAGLHLKQVRFYTGYPAASDDAKWAAFWQKKLLAISRQGVFKFSRQLRYRAKTIKLGDGATLTQTVGEEKGIDVRIAIDVIRLMLDDEYDVAVIFSQDQDLSEATDEVKKIARKSGRWSRVVCAFPVSESSPNKRGIDRTDWIRISQADYEKCVDPNDYR